MRSVAAAAVILILTAICDRQTETQLWPEADTYLNFTRFTRISVQGHQAFEDGEDIVKSQAAGYLDTAPLLLITSLLRNNNDVFRQRYVVLRLGYLYSTSFVELTKSSH